MKKNTRMLLGISVALITAASLHLTVGNRFHREFGRHGFGPCGNQWSKANGPEEMREDKQAEPARRY
jgi:hypothetical protein